MNSNRTMPIGNESGTVKVVHGMADLEMDLAGFPVEEIKFSSGLDVEKAIRKVGTDAEVGENARKARIKNKRPWR